MGVTGAPSITGRIERGQPELARLPCNDLLDRTRTILHGWDSDLSRTSKDNCLNAKSQLESLLSEISRLAARGVGPAPKQLLIMQDSCRKIRDIFVVEHASAMKKIDEAENA